MNATDLRVFLDSHFDDAELRALAFDLAIPYEDLGADDLGKGARIQKLIEWCIRREQLPDLARAAMAARSTARPQTTANSENDDMNDAISASLTAAEVKRLIAMTDETNKTMAQLVTDIALLQRDIDDLKRQFAAQEQRAAWLARVQVGIWLVLSAMSLFLLWHIAR